MGEPITITVNDAGKIADVDFVQWIMNEIEDRVYTRADVAKTYAILIQKGHTEFLEINRAIIARWSPSALGWIKERAYRSIQKERAAWEKYGGCTCMGHNECDFCKERK
ncbi:MAG TPA: hypothetical protein VHO25_10100 [Polyangiaceae bacterium]|nr:hypothetical protein [Polyangiaceae bacterium]